MADTLYVPPVSAENNVIDQLIFQFKKVIQALTPLSGSIISTQAAQSVNIQEATLDYIFLDPPFEFQHNVFRIELYTGVMVNNVVTNNELEAIENKTQNKGVSEYRNLMTHCFEMAFRYLKSGRWMTVEFSNTKRK